MSYYKFSDGRVYEFSHVPNDAEKLTNKAGKAAAMEQARNDLRAILKPGDTVNVILRHCARSGMMRHLSLLVANNGDIQDITHLAAIATGSNTTDRGYIKMGGCGMDMGFACVYDLSRSLWPEGFKLAENQHGRNGDKSGFDRDGGYALRHSWM